MTLFALHGFLGRPEDWRELLPSAHCIELYQTISPFWDWAKSFNRNAALFPSDRILIGYSLGGRLALHALIDNPALWQGAVVISANPGICQREERVLQDEAWSQRFRTEEWEPLLADWNQQPMFSPSPFPREERDFSRSALAEVLSTWSLGRQENLLQEIEALSVPILWITGERDEKFCKVAEQVMLSHPLSRKCVIPNAFHRVPWEAPVPFQSLLSDFLLTLEKKPS